MDQEALVTLMHSSRSQKEWTDNCAVVKRAHNGSYPARLPKQRAR